MSEETQQFNAADVYQPLTIRRSSEQELVNLLISQVAPLLPTHVLRKDERAPRIEEILSLLEHLRSRYAVLLENHGHQGLAKRVRDRWRTMDAAIICREIPRGEKRDEIRVLLAQERSLMSAELLERLGFLPSYIYKRGHEDASGQDGDTEDVVERQRAESRFMLLREFLEREGFTSAALSDPEGAIAGSTTAQIIRYPRNARLAHWISDANRDFDKSVHDAFMYLAKLFKDAAPSGPEGQAFEPISDLGSKTFIELLEIILDYAMPILTRFESMRLLEWAIAFFSLRRNPMYQAQREVRARINQILEEEFWHENTRKLPVEISPELLSSVQKDEKTTLATLSRSEVGRFLVWCAKHNYLQSVAEQGNTSGDRASIILSVDKIILAEFYAEEKKQQDRPVILRARKVRQEIEDIMNENDLVETKSRDRIIFGNREKSEYSMARKIFLLQLLVQKCRATLEGQKTGMTKKDAREELRKLRERLLVRGKKSNDIKLKTVGFDTLDDDVGYSLSINLEKPLDEHNDAERNLVSGMFKKVGEHAASILGLQNIYCEDFLWDRNFHNKKSAAGFRIYKVHGEYPIKKEIFVEEGGIEEKTLMVPVEIQILPVETLLRTKMPGDVSADAYERRKARELAQRNHPTHIGDTKVYSEAFDVGRFADVLNMTAETSCVIPPEM